MEAGLVASLAQPGGNITGLSTQLADLPGKRLQLAREIGMGRLGLMFNLASDAELLVFTLPTVTRQSDQWMI